MARIGSEAARRERRRNALLLRVGLLLAALPAASAHAQPFRPSAPLELQPSRRFTLAVYAAQWENPFKVTLQVGPATIRTRVVADTPVSPLYEGSYRLNDRWSVGFWYNPIRGERVRKQLRTGGLTVDVDRDVDLGDVHVVYDASHGLSAQLGYYREHGTLREHGDRSAEQEYTLVSWNIWLTQRLDARWQDRLLTPFVSVGYHPATAMNHSVSVLTGIAVTLKERFTLSGSVWLFDLADPATRITGGVAIRL